MSRARQGGFSLLEVLVAFSILAISLGVMMQIFSRAALTTAASSQYSQAASLAETLLSKAGVEIPLEDGAASGATADGFEWELTMVPVELGDRAFVDPPATPYRVSATVLWRDAGRVRRLLLATLRLGERL